MRSSTDPNAPSERMLRMARGAIAVIRDERFKFTSKAKEVDYKKDKADLVTSADYAGQALYLRMIRELFPDFGIIAEEDDFHIPCQRTDGNFFFTVDPLDGTKAFGRRQSHGVSTMISLVKDGVVIAAYIGDINTHEIYGFGPESGKVLRISDYEHSEELSVDPERSLTGQYVLLRDAPTGHSQFIQEMVRDYRTGGLFKELEVEGGSFGWGVARLWKGEVGGYVFRAGMQPPWDMAPVIGISRAMGFVFVRCEKVSDSEFGGRFNLIPFTPEEYLISRDVVNYHYETIIVHESRLNELLNWTHSR